MTESMIERVAKALRKEFRGKDIDEPLEAGDLMGLGAYTDLARAAIEAMREPTETMWKKVFDEPISPHSRDLSTYQSLIDAALIWPADSADKAGVPMARD